MAASQQFCVRWNSHLGSLGAAFPQLLAGGRFVDCTLACEGRQLTCHRLVLAACSGFFETLLGENPCQHPIIILKDVRFWELQALVDFMYKGEVNVTQEGLQDLLKCAETLQIRGLSGADSALKNLSDPTAKTDEICSTSNTNHHLNNVEKEETVPYQEDHESDMPSISDIKQNSTDSHENFSDTNNISVNPEIDSPDSRYSNGIMDEDLTMNVKSEITIEENLNKSQSEKFLKVRNSSELFENSIDNIDQETNFICPPQLHYNKDVMAIIPCISTSPKKRKKIEQNYIHKINISQKSKSIVKKLLVNQNTNKVQDEKYSNAKSAEKMSDDDNDDTDLLKESVKHIEMSDLNLKNDLMRGVIRSGRNGSFRAYDNESLWNALMDIKGGSSIYRASQVYNVPRKTLRNWMKRWDIKSSYPMPRQLKQFVDNMKLKKQS